MFTIQIKEINRWFPTTFKSNDKKLALKHASERAREIGEENVRILLDGKEFL